MKRGLSRPAGVYRLALVVFLVSNFIQPAWAQRLGQGTEAASVSYGQVAGVILFLTALTGGAWWLVRLRGATIKLWADPVGKRLRITETARLSPHNMLCLAQWDDKEYLVAFTVNGAQLLDTRPANAEGDPS
jgi:hypothetical protein